MDLTIMVKKFNEGDMLSIEIKQLKDQMNCQKNVDYLRNALAVCCKKLPSTTSHKFSRHVEVCIKLLFLETDKDMELKTGGKTVSILYQIISFLLKEKLLSTAVDVGSLLTEVETDAVTENDNKIFLNLSLKYIQTAVTLVTTKADIKHVSKLFNISVELMKKADIKDLAQVKTIVSNIFYYVEKINYWEMKEVVLFLNNMQNVFKNMNYLFIKYYLLRISLIRVKDLNNEQLQIVLDKICNLVKCILYSDKLSSVVKLLCNVVNHLFSIRNLQKTECVNELEKNLNLIFQSCSNKKLNKDQVNIIYILLSFIFNNALIYWVSNCREELGNKISVKFIQQVVYNSLLQKIIKYNLNSNERECFSHNNKSDDRTVCFNYIAALNCCQMITVIQNCLKNQAPDGLCLVSLGQITFKSCFNIIHRMGTATCDLVHQTNTWQSLAASMFNMIERLSHKPDKVVSWSLLSECCCLFIESVIKKKWELSFDINLFYTIFGQWHYACMQQMQYKEALFSSALYLIAYPNRREQALNLWVQVKEEDERCETQNTSLVDVLVDNQQRLKHMNVSWNELNKKSMLIVELRVYDSVALSKLKPSVENVWKQLKDLNPNLTERACALTMIIPATINLVTSSEINLYKEECLSIAECLAHSDQKKAINLCYSGQLQYCIFLCNQLELQDLEEQNLKTSEEVVKHLQDVAAEKVKHGDLVDLNISCDVIPQSNRLTIEFEEEFMSPLDTAYDMWYECCNIIQVDDFEPVELDSYLHCVKLLAYTYELYGNKSKSVRVWWLLYRLAGVANKSHLKLLAISRLVETLPLSANTDLLTEAETLAQELVNDKFRSLSHELRYIVFRYWLTIAMINIYKRDYETSFCVLMKCKEHMSKIRNYQYNICESRYYMYCSVLLVARPDYNKHFAIGSLRNIVFWSYFHLYSYLKYNDSVTTSQHNEVMTICLENMEWCVQFYGIFQLPIFMRSMVEVIFPLVYQRNLATRTCQILIQLANIDIINCKTEECYAKLRKIKCILSDAWDCDKEVEPKMIPNRKSNLLTIETSNQPTSPNVSPSRYRDVSKNMIADDKSPIRMLLKEYNTTQYKDHNMACVCYNCNNITVQTYKLHCVSIESVLLAMTKHNQQSAKLFTVGYNMSKLLKTRRERVCGMLKDETGLSDVDCFQLMSVSVATCLFNICYCKFLLSSDKMDEQVMSHVLHMMSKIDGCVDDCNYMYTLVQPSLLQVKIHFCYLINKSTAVNSVSAPAAVSPDGIQTDYKTRTPSKLNGEAVNAAAPVKRKIKVHFSSKKEKQIDFETVTDDCVEDEQTADSKPKLDKNKLKHYKTPKTKITKLKTIKVYEDKEDLLSKTKRRRSKSLPKCVSKSPELGFSNEQAKTVIKRRPRRNVKKSLNTTFVSDSNDSTHDLFTSFEEQFHTKCKVDNDVDNTNASSTSGRLARLRIQF